jgi:hypothetical protein
MLTFGRMHQAGPQGLKAQFSSERMARERACSSRPPVNRREGSREFESHSLRQFISFLSLAYVLCARAQGHKGAEALGPNQAGRGTGERLCTVDSLTSPDKTLAAERAVDCEMTIQLSEYKFVTPALGFGGRVSKSRE